MGRRRRALRRARRGPGAGDVVVAAVVAMAVAAMTLAAMTLAAATPAAAVDWSPLARRLRPDEDERDVPLLQRIAARPAALIVDDAETAALAREIVRGARAAQDTCGPSGRRVRIAGGGPVGLLAAAKLAFQGDEVTVLERRAAYTRDVWFDMYAPPWASGVAWLRDMGFFEIAQEGPDYASHGAMQPGEVEVYSIRCRSLEGFLVLAALGAGADVRFNAPARGDASFLGEADLLIDASGGRGGGVWSQAAGLKSEHARNIQWHEALYPVADSWFPVQQWSWLARLSTCASDMPAQDPFYLGTKGGVGDVVAVFRREFADICEVQVLLRSTVESASSALRVVEDAVLTRFEDRQPQEARLLQLQVTHLDRQGVVGARLGGVPLIVVGDASVPAYYRMGVGISAGFAQVDLVATHDAQTDLKDLQAQLWRLQVQHASFQAAVMAIETGCPNAFVGFDLGATSMHHAPILYKYESDDFVEVDVRDCLPGAP